MVHTPWPIDISINGVWASTAPECVELVEQRYDFENAELLTQWRFRSGGATATVETTAFCPRSVPSLAAVEVAVSLDARADLPHLRRDRSDWRAGIGDSHAQPQQQGPNEGVDGRLRWHSGGNSPRWAWPIRPCSRGTWRGALDSDTGRSRPILHDV